MTEWENLGLPGIGGLEPSGAEASGAVSGDGAGLDAGLSDGLTLDLGGVSYDLPAAVTQADCGEDMELLEESVTLTDDTGMTICSDTDGDGLVDYMSVVTFDGGWSAWRREVSMTDTTDTVDITDSVEDDAPGESRSGVSSVTVQTSVLGADVSETLQVEVGIGNDGASDVPPVTPGNGTSNWDTVGWKCVERGRWG